MEIQRLDRQDTVLLEDIHYGECFTCAGMDGVYMLVQDKDGLRQVINLEGWETDCFFEDNPVTLIKIKAVEVE